MSVSRNIPRLLAFRFLSDFIVVMPAIVPVYRAAGLSATEIMMVQAIFSAAGLAFEVPSGYLADVAGRRRALLLGMAAQAAGFAAYGVSRGFWTFAGAEVALAFGYSMVSGTASAMLFDSLRAAGDEARYHRTEGHAEALTRLGTATAAILGGLMAAVSLRLPFAVNVGIALVGLGIVASLVEPPRDRLRAREGVPGPSPADETRAAQGATTEHASLACEGGATPRGEADRPSGRREGTSSRALTGHAPLRELLRVTTETLRDRQLQATMLLSAALFATGITAIWGYFMRLTGEGISVAAYGLYFAIFQAASAAGAATSDRVSGFLGRRGSVALLALVPATLLACAVDGSWRPILLTPLASAAWGFSTPFLLSILNRNLASDRRATVLSVSAMLGRILLVVVGPAFGWLSDHVSDRAAFAALAAAFLATAAAAGALHRRAAATAGAGV